MPFTPINKTTTAQSVADQILDMIRRGELRPGDKLPSERELIEILDVGRSSVREALQSLAMLNLIEIIPGYGTRVKALQTADILRADVIGLLLSNSVSRELLEAREIIEPAAIRLACLRGTEDDFEQIDALLQAHDHALRAGQPVNVLSARFHGLLAQASHNGVVLRFMESLVELLTQRGQKIEYLPGYAAEELAQHRAIFERVRARDADGAAEKLLEHLVISAAAYDAGQTPVQSMDERDAI